MNSEFLLCHDLNNQTPTKGSLTSPTDYRRHAAHILRRSLLGILGKENQFTSHVCDLYQLMQHIIPASLHFRFPFKCEKFPVDSLICFSIAISPKSALYKFAFMLIDSLSTRGELE